MRLAFDGLLRDLILAARRLLATPLFLIFAVASISIGIATTTAAYSILYALLWKPLGIHQPDQVVAVGTRSVTSGALLWRNAASLADFEALDARQQGLEDLAALTAGSYTFVTPSSSEVANFEAVSGKFFRTIRVQARLGRMIQAEDDARQADVVVLSDRTWRTRFHGDRNIVGKTAKIGGRPFEIVGVAPESFPGLTMRMLSVAGWLPLRTANTLVVRRLTRPEDERHRARLAVLGRLPSSGALTNASSEIEAIGAARDVEAPTRAIPIGKDSTYRFPRAWTLKSIATADDVPMQANVAVLLLTLVGLVLVVACTNLGNLTLSRGAYRQHELAVRRALGATRWRLVRELFAETVLIATLASICTVLLTQALLVFATQEISTPLGAFSFAPQLNAPAATVSALALAISMLVFGLEPAFALTRRRAAMSLAEGVGTFGAGRNTRQRAFIRWQVAISVCFFLIAATITRGIATMALHDSGIAVGELALASVGSPPQMSEDQIRLTAERAAEIARQRGDLSSVAITNGMPYGLAMTAHATMKTPEGAPLSGPLPTTAMIAASPEFFRTLGIPIVRGRQFNDRDAGAGVHVVVLSEWTAVRLFGSAEASIGRSLTLQESQRGTPLAYTVIGVARQTDVSRMMLRRDHLVYVPLAEATGRNFALVARTTGSTAGAARALQDALRAADPDVGSGMSGPASWLIAGPYVVGRIAAALAGSLGLLTLTLAMIGLYGVQVQAVAFRTREMGVRMALGAAAAQIKRMVLREGARPVIEGVLLGCFFGAMTRGILRVMFSDTTITMVDPVVFLSVPIPFAIAALIACYLPARRAGRVDPNVALRHL
jgi:predicted permease